MMDIEAYKTEVEFLLEESKEIVFIYYKEPSRIEFTKFGADLLSCPKLIADPYHNEFFIKRISISCLNEIKDNICWDATERKEFLIHFMSKPFMLSYRILFQQDEPVGLIGQIKEKMEY